MVVVVLIRTFLIINLVNSMPPDFAVTKMVESVSAGNVAKAPPHLGPAILLTKTIKLITVPVTRAFKIIGLPEILFEINLWLILIFLFTNQRLRVTRINHQRTATTKLFGVARAANIAEQSHMRRDTKTPCKNPFGEDKRYARK